MNSNQNGGFSIEERIGGLLDSRSMEIGEFCDSVQIIATTKDPRSGEPVLWYSGCGDMFARDGALRAYLASREVNPLGSASQDDGYGDQPRSY